MGKHGSHPPHLHGKQDKLTYSFQTHRHGDHWHCDGPASATSTAGDAAAQTSGTASSVTPAEQTGSSGADHIVAGLGAVVIAGMVAVL